MNLIAKMELDEAVMDRCRMDKLGSKVEGWITDTVPGFWKQSWRRLSSSANSSISSNSIASAAKFPIR